MTTRVYDVAVIGAGPAGMVAASTTAALGLATLVLDEAGSPGGQVYCAITTTPLRDPAILGDAYWHGAQLLNPFRSSGAIHRPGALVWAAERRESGRYALGVVGTHEPVIEARALVIATGAIERPFPIAGWTLPGVIAAGGTQRLLKSAGLRPSGRVVLAGCGPLLWLVAQQLLNAGSAIDLVLDTTPRGRITMRHLAGFMASRYFARGVELVRSVRRRARVVDHVDALVALGENRLVGVRYAVAGAWHEAPADLLLLSQGVVPNVHLPAALGCGLRWNAAQAAFEPIVDTWGGTTLPDVFVAGDGAGIAGADAATARGALAGLAAANALGRIDASRRDRDAKPHRRALARALRGRAFLDAVYRPVEAFRLPVGDTLACRCEEVTAEAIRAAIRAGARTPDEVKSATRCGMGLCQGRFCALTVAELCASERAVAAAEVGHPRVRLPVKPVPLATLAAWPPSQAADDAVLRELRE